MTAVGVVNPNSRMKDYGIENPLDTLPLRMSVMLYDLEDLATWIAAKFDLAIFHQQEVKIREYERQLAMIAEYANELKEVMG